MSANTPFSSLQLTKKQILSIADATAFINIWEGSIRSGKTWASIVAFAKFVFTAPPGELMLCGSNIASIERNVITPFEQLFGNYVSYEPGNQILRIGSRSVSVIGAPDKAAYSKIQGATLIGAYVDEMSLIPQNFYEALVGRLSLRGAKLFGTTNPDSPYHWLKAKLDEADGVFMRVFHFRLEDNYHLPAEYVSNIKRSFSGLFYKRYVEGKWVLAEGAVFDMFEERLHVTDFSPSHTAEYIVGVDYGTTNPCAFIMIGINRDRVPNIFVAKEFYYDSKKAQRQKTDLEYAKDLSNFVEGYAPRAIYIDPSAASFKLELSRSGIQGLQDAKNEVEDGIRLISRYLNEGTLKITRSCPNLIREMQSYVWDSRAQERGLDQPLKTNDHCFCAGTLIEAIGGLKSIEDIKVDDLVLTRSGFKRVNRIGNNIKDASEFSLYGRTIKCTSDHRFFTERGWVEIGNLIRSDILYTNEDLCPRETISNTLNSTVTDIDAIHALQSSMSEITSLETENICIERFTSDSLERYPPDIIFITKTGTPLTMIYPTCNASLHPSITQFISQLSPLIESRIRQEAPQGDGTNPLKAKLGIESTQSDLTSETFPCAASIACNAETSLQQKKRAKHPFVRISVNLKGGGCLNLIMSLKTALSVISGSHLVNTLEILSAQNLAEERPIGKQRVYNLEVEDCHEFFAEGFLVHNSIDAMRYALYSHLFLTPERRQTAQDLERHYREATGMKPDLPSFFQDPRVMGY